MTYCRGLSKTIENDKFLLRVNTEIPVILQNLNLVCCKAKFKILFLTVYFWFKTCVSVVFCFVFCFVRAGNTFKECSILECWSRKYYQRCCGWNQVPTQTFLNFPLFPQTGALGILHRSIMDDSKTTAGVSEDWWNQNVLIKIWKMKAQKYVGQQQHSSFWLIY